MKSAISDLVIAAVQAAVDAGELPLSEVPDPALERPRDASHGDWATTVALRSAKAAGMNPRAVAEIVAGRMAGHADIDGVEIAGPGFINIRLSPHALQRVLADARTQGPDFGRVGTGAGKRVQVEFVSANPTGPLHVGHGRGAAYGASLSNLLDFAGCAVVITHDRWFLDRIATHILAFEGDSQVTWFEGSWGEYAAWVTETRGPEALEPHRIAYKPLVRP